MMTKIKKTKALIKSKMPLAWGSIMSKDNQALAVRQACKDVAKVFGVPTMGVNVLGSQPYLNKDGRLYLLNDIRKGNRALKSIKTDFIQVSTGPNIASICKKILEFKDGLTVESIGEAATENVKLAAVKLTLNMMAETRALNRAIWQAIAGDVWKMVAVNLQKMNLTETEEQQIIKAGGVSYEEMSGAPIKETKLFEQAKSLIENAKTITLLMILDSRIQDSKEFTKEEKKELIDLIHVKANKIQK